jgi:peptide chain release factor 2
VPERALPAPQQGHGHEDAQGPPLRAGEGANRQEQQEHLHGDKKEIAWGSQIRSYVLQPYRLIKDHRTNHETGNVDAVLDGNLDPFIKAYLLWQH